MFVFPEIPITAQSIHEGIILTMMMIVNQMSEQREMIVTETGREIVTVIANATETGKLT